MKSPLSLLVFSFYLLVSVAQPSRTSQHQVFDDHDRLAVLITYTYDSTGTVETRQLQSFDREGRLTRTELYTADEHLLFTEDIRYDRHGNRKRLVQTTYDEEGVPTRQDFRYSYTRSSDNKWILGTIRLNGETIYTNSSQ